MRDSAREGEPDRYLAALLAPAALTSDLMILAGLGAELARIPAQIREPMMGEIRLQWWRDAIAGAARGEASGQATADAVGGLLARHGIAAARLDPLLEACLVDIGRELLADDAALLAHLDGREGTLFGLALVVAGVARGPDADAAALAAGRAYGLARSLGRLPYHLGRGGFPIPATRLARRFAASAHACGCGRVRGGDGAGHRQGLGGTAGPGTAGSGGSAGTSREPRRGGQAGPASARHG